MNEGGGGLTMEVLERGVKERESGLKKWKNKGFSGQG